jgi:hypothetical protein
VFRCKPAETASVYDGLRSCSLIWETPAKWPLRAARAYSQEMLSIAPTCATAMPLSNLWVYLLALQSSAFSLVRESIPLENYPSFPPLSPRTFFVSSFVPTRFSVFSFSCRGRFVTAGDGSFEGLQTRIFANNRHVVNVQVLLPPHYPYVR